MTTPQREWKHIQRQLRGIPVEAVAPRVAAYERDGLWCLVCGGLEFIPSDGGFSVTDWDDMLEYAQFKRYVAAHPERVHESRDLALAFVRSRFGVKGSQRNAAPSDAN